MIKWIRLFVGLFYGAFFMLLFYGFISLIESGWPL